MTTSNKQNTETKTSTTVEALSETELNQASGGIIAVLRKGAQMGDGSVVPSPMAAQSAKPLIGL